MAWERDCGLVQSNLIETAVAAGFQLQFAEGVLRYSGHDIRRASDAAGCDQRDTRGYGIEYVRPGAWAWNQPVARLVLLPWTGEIINILHSL